MYLTAGLLERSGRTPIPRSLEIHRDGHSGSERNSVPFSCVRVAYRIQEFPAEVLKPGCIGRWQSEPSFSDFSESLVENSCRNSLGWRGCRLANLDIVDYVAHPPNTALPNSAVLAFFGSTIQTHQHPPEVVWNNDSRYDESPNKNGLKSTRGEIWRIQD